MSEHNTDIAWERINEDLGEHIENYFRDSGTEETDKELLDFIWSNNFVWKTLRESIESSKLGEKIAQMVFDNLPDGPEEDSNEDR